MSTNRSNQNPYAEVARLKKVIALADVIQDAGLTVLSLGDLNDTDWKQIASLAPDQTPTVKQTKSALSKPPKAREQRNTTLQDGSPGTSRYQE